MTKLRIDRIGTQGGNLTNPAASASTAESPRALPYSEQGQATSGSAAPLLTRLLLALRRAFRPNRKIRPTGQGLVFMTLTLSIGFAALNTGNNLLYLILAMMLSLLSLSGILAELSIGGLKVARAFPSDATAGEPTRAYIRLRNDKRTNPALGIRVDERTQHPVECISAHFGVVAAGEEQSCPVWYQFAGRGRVQLDCLECWTSYPFGFFVRGLVRHVQDEILVLPPVREWKERPQSQHALEGEHPRPRRGMGDEFLELRGFVEGDDPRRIHWKSTARRRQLMVRENAEQQRSQVLLRLELQTVLPDEEVYEEALIEVVSAAANFLERGCEVAVEAPGCSIPFEGGNAHLLRIRRALALAPRAAEAAECAPSTARIPAGAVIVIPVTLERER